MMKIKHNNLTNIVSWFKAHPPAMYASVGVLLILISGGTTALLLSQPSKKVDFSPAAVAKKPKLTEKYYAPLTGNEVTAQADTTKPVTAIMIENSPDARPQSGLKDAEIVYEAIAEGGITRFMALYQQNKPDLIGPVRSVRPYYVDWVVPYNASVAHVGGSAKALAEIRNGSYRDIDQFFNASSYYRATDRYAPHNVYTTFQRLDTLNTAKNYTTSNPIGFERANENPSKTPNATSIDVTISSPLFNSTYAYDAASNSYARSQGGAPHLDREKGQITPKVIIVLDVNESTVVEDTARQSIETIGSGEATIFQNGTATKATWHRDARDKNYSFTDANGQSIKLSRGQTWITAIPNGQGSVSWK